MPLGYQGDVRGQRVIVRIKGGVAHCLFAGRIPDTRLAVVMNLFVRPFLFLLFRQLFVRLSYAR